MSVGVKVPVILSVTPYGRLQDAIRPLPDETTEFFVPRGDGEPTFTDTNHATTYTEAAMGPSLTRSYLVYESNPLPRDIHISGVTVLDLNMKSTLHETHLCILISKKAPDGTLTDFSGGMLNTRNRNGLDKSESVAPGTPFRAPVEAYEIDYVIRKGHRLRMMVASGCPLAQPENAGPATNTILEGSVLRLPVIAGAEVLGQQSRAVSYRADGQYVNRPRLVRRAAKRPVHRGATPSSMKV